MATMTKMLFHLPVPMKKRLDSMKAKGYTASGFLRALLEKEFSNQPKTTKKGA